ncbi:MAG: ATP-binding cassette domain-containing protein [Bacilli bacterium]|jgi:energy-coupling factor transport system ATP-binding protein|nr:ATP-binding cassette domain-containing protein [Bacilli bacterium]
MPNIIKIKNLSFGYDDKQIFNKFNLEIEAGDWVSIIGPNSSGKSTLVRLLVGLACSNKAITVDTLMVNQEKIVEVRKRIGVIFDDLTNQFISDTVRDDIAFGLENLNYDIAEIHTRIMRIARELKIEHLLDADPQRLSGGEKQKVALAAILVMQPKIIILDEALAMLDTKEQREILNILKVLHEKRKLTVINITHNLEETLYGNRIIVLNKGKTVMEGKTLDVLKEERILTKLGLELPFMVDLSLKLNFYNLLDDIILDMDELITKLWPSK